MKKIKYLIVRIKNMNYKNMFKTINEIHKLSGKSKLYIIFDIIRCAFKYRSGYMDYLLYEMWYLNSDQRETILTRGKNDVYVKYYNNKNYFNLFSNKDEFNEYYKEFLNREYFIIKMDNKDEFNKWLKNKKEIFCKPINGVHGDGAQKIIIKEFDEDIFDYLSHKNLRLVEEVVKQTDKMNKLYPYSVNTLRLVTVHKYDDTCHLLGAYLRIGNHGNVIDNFNGGGMVVKVNDETGVIEHKAIDKLKNVYDVHPITNTKIVGFKVPKFKEAVNLVLKTAKMSNYIRYVAWDIAITDDGPVIIEGNEYPGYDIMGLPVHRDNNEGVLPKFERIMGKIEDLEK